MNGFDFKEHQFVENIFQFMYFAVKNEHNLRSVDTLRKFMTGEVIMSHGGQHELLGLEFPE
jgi:hypothetical protein